MRTKEEILKKQLNSENRPITDYIGIDSYVWKMIINAMEEYAQQQANESDTSHEQALHIADVMGSVSEKLKIAETALNNTLKCLNGHEDFQYDDPEEIINRAFEKMALVDGF